MMRGFSAMSRCSTLARLLSTAASSAAAPPCLVREFIHDSLYHPTYGYFSSRLAPVGTLRHPLDFPGFYGQRDYFARVQEVYKELQVAWLTPVEIFQPHYGSAIARYIVQLQGQHEQRAQQRPLRLYEIGGGTGTLARNILDWLREHHPSIYSSCRYTCLEISPTLAQLQQQRVAVEGGHNSCFDVVRQDAARADAWGGPSDESCYIIMMEVLDNLPHDRVWRPEGNAPWHQTLVESLRASSASSTVHLEQEQRLQERQEQWREQWQLHQPQQQQQQQQQQEEEADPWRLLQRSYQDRQQGQQQEQESGGPAGWGRAETYQELLAPATDPLILRCLRCLQEEQEGSRGWGRHVLRDWLSAAVGGPAEGETVFLPTGCLQLLDTLHAMRPSHHLIAADFDQLPEVVIAGRNAPLVATTISGCTMDHVSYLVPKGSADIFFPTDFCLLRRLYADAAQRAQHGGQWTQQGSADSLAQAAGQRPGAAPLPRAAGQHMKTAAFMRRYADQAATTTRSGYNPLLEDYSNTVFFLGHGGAALP